MAGISNAIEALGITMWRLQGNPETEDEFLASFERIIGTDENGDLIYSTDPSDFGVTWAEIQEKYNQIVAEEPLNQLRIQRDKLIAQTDWTQVPDSPLDTADKSAWQNYRQALRDITQTYTSLDDVVWPTKPGEEV